MSEKDITHTHNNLGPLEYFLSDLNCDSECMEGREHFFMALWGSWENLVIGPNQYLWVRLLCSPRIEITKSNVEISKRKIDI